MCCSKIFSSLLVTILVMGPAPEEAAAQGNDFVAMRSVPKKGIEIPPSSDETVALWHYYYANEALTYRQDSLVVRDAYLGILERWADAPGIGEVQLLSHYEYLLYHSDTCFSAEQFEALSQIAGSGQGAILPAAMLHLSAWQYDLGRKNFRRLEANARRLEILMKAHVNSTARSPEALSEAADFLTHMAERIWDSGYFNLFDLADSALDRAVDFEPDHIAGRYLRSMISEKRGFYRKTVRDLEHLHRLKPLQGDITLRLAINLARRGEDERAAELLDSLIERRTRIEDWVHHVAFQEAARLAMDREKWRRAGEILTQAQEAYPKNKRFELMEIDLHRRATHRPDPRSRMLLDEWDSDFGETPRLRYLRGPLPELEANRRALSERTNLRAPALSAGVRRLQSGEQGASPRCAGLWRRLLPLGDPPQVAEIAADSTDNASAASNGTAARASYVKQVKDPILPTADGPANRPSVRQPAVETGQQVYYDETTGQPIRVDETLDLELTELYVTPSRFGRKGLKLKASDLQVFDEGLEQEIVTFEQGDVPFTATLLIDASGSMVGPRMTSALTGAKTFMQNMAPLDRARLVIAADRLRGVSSFVDAEDASLHDLTDRLDRTSVGGGTALFDFLFLSTDALQPEHGRKVVVVLSDGFDMMSAVPMQSVREAIRRSQIQLYWVRLREGKDHEKGFVPSTGWRPIGETQKQLSMLERTVKESGGDVVEITDVDQVTGAFNQILEDLRNQVAIGYYADPSLGDGSWRKVNVKARGLGIRLRHVAGYFDG